MSNFREVPDEYAHCRAWGHTWDFTTVDKNGSDYIQGMKCTMCPTRRAVPVSGRTGLRERGNKYIYPEDADKSATPYKMPKGSGGNLTSEERGHVTLQDIEARYRASTRKKRKRA